MKILVVGGGGREHAIIKKLKLSNEIDEIYKWKLEDIFQSEALWAEEYEKVSSKLYEIKKHSGKFTKSAAGFLQCLKDLYTLAANVNKVFVYYILTGNTHLVIWLMTRKFS